MKWNELEQGRRVRLLVDLDGGRFTAGDTGFLFFIKHENDQYWGVVFDKEYEIEGDGAPVVVRCETTDGNRVRAIDVVEPIAKDLSEDTQELQPLDQQFVEAAHEMELIKQLAAAQDALDKAVEGNTVTFTGLIQLNEKRDSAVKALINFCRDRWLPDPVYAPIGGD